MRFGLVAKLVLPNVALVAIGFILITIFGYQASKNAIETSVENQLLHATEAIARNAKLWLQSRKLETHSWSETDIYQKSLQDGFLGEAARKAAKRNMQKLKKDYAVYEFLALVKPSGEIIATSEDEEVKLDQELIIHPAFQQALKGEHSSIHAIPSPRNGLPISLIYNPVMKGENIEGVLIASINLNAFGNDFVKSAQLGESGRVSVYRSDNQMVLDSHDQKLFQTSAGDQGLILSNASGQTGVMRYQQKNINRIAGYARVSELGLTVVSSAEEDEVLAGARKARTITVMTSLIIGLIIALASYLIVKALLGPIRSTVTMLKDLSVGEGDLTQRLHVNTHDEVAELANYFNSFVNKLQELVIAMRESTNRVSETSNDMTLITQESGKSVVQQKHETDAVASAIHEMAATAQNVAQHANEAASFATRADEEAVRGREVVGNTITSINQLAKDVDGAAQVIEDLRSASLNIGTVLEVIKSIAEQTNLLALNAAIEAARAGEQGRGFAVVADEVRTLAQRTQKSTHEIEETIDLLQNEAQQAVKSSETSRNRALETVNQAALAGETLEAITQAIVSINDMNHQIASAAEEQSVVAEEINSNINTIHQLAEKAETGVSQALNESDKLKQSSMELVSAVSQFKV